MTSAKALMVAALLGLSSACLAQGSTHPQMLGFTPGQETVLMEANRITDAAELCDFVIVDSKLDALMHGAAIGATDMEIRAVSPTLKSDIDADRKAYAKDKATACAKAWAAYGPQGPAGVFLSK